MHLWILVSWREVNHKDTDTHHTPTVPLHNIIDGKYQLRAVISHNQPVCME